MRKNLLLIIILLCCLEGLAQQTPYTLPLPEKWTQEKIVFPIGFAPSIPFKGNEELRFTPGWSNAANNQYWSYTYLWFIEGTPKLNSDTLQNYLTVYFNGLFRSNNKSQADNTNSLTKAKIRKTASASGDQETYEGKISTLNFLTGKPLMLFARIHVRNYPGSSHSAILFELSPKSYDDAVWGDLDGIVNGFKYN